eukprot:2414237-Rhodomonas_salina.1
MHGRTKFCESAFVARRIALLQLSPPPMDLAVSRSHSGNRFRFYQRYLVPKEIASARGRKLSQKAMARPCDGQGAPPLAGTQQLAALAFLNSDH